MIDLDSEAARAFDDSALVRAVERGARTLRTWATGSLTMTRTTSWRQIARSRTGHVILVAAATHILLMITIGRPQSWQWVILPSMALLAGAVMIAGTPPKRTDR
jgi:hypothetical protein